MRITATVVLALFVLVTTVCVYLKQDVIRGLFGPPTVVLAENHTRQPNGPRFDHSVLERLLAKYVDQDGKVDYQGLSREVSALDTYLTSIANSPFDDMDRHEKLALLINAYNAFTIRLILDYYPLESIKDIPASKRWDHVRWRVGASTWSLNQIEHEQIRPNFTEPRIHFALVCAAVGCPPLRNEAYQATRLEDQLEDQARRVHRHDRWFQYESEKNSVRLTPLYNWYGGDFEQVAGSVLKFAARYSSPLKRQLDANRRPKIRWLDYDWSLNRQ